jgi:hypothetical protein
VIPFAKTSAHLNEVPVRRRTVFTATALNDSKSVVKTDPSAPTRTKTIEESTSTNFSRSIVLADVDGPSVV